MGLQGVTNRSLAAAVDESMPVDVDAAVQGFGARLLGLPEIFEGHSFLVPDGGFNYEVQHLTN